MFRPISENLSVGAEPMRDRFRATIGFSFDGLRMSARAGDTVAAALLANGVETFRETPVSGARRGPYCLMGVCFDCLVVIDGVGNRQACLTLVEDGMKVETQHGARRTNAPEARER